MAASAPIHAGRGNGRTYTAADRCRSGKTSTNRRLTNDHLKPCPNLHLLDGRSPPFGAGGIEHTGPDHTEFELADAALDAEQQPIVRPAGIVNPVQVDH